MDGKTLYGMYESGGGKSADSMGASDECRKGTVGARGEGSRDMVRRVLTDLPATRLDVGSVTQTYQW